jgi:hypothetical protein
MTDDTLPSPKPDAAEPAAPDAVRPPYEPPRILKKRAVSRATLFSGGGGPSSAPPLVTNG